MRHERHLTKWPLRTARAGWQSNISIWLTMDRQDDRRFRHAAGKRPVMVKETVARQNAWFLDQEVEDNADRQCGPQNQ